MSTRHQSKDSFVVDLTKLTGAPTSIYPYTTARQKIRRNVEAIDELLTSLYYDTTSQQRLYDADALRSVLPTLRSLHLILGSSGALSPPSFFVLNKLLAHDAFGSNQQWHLAIQLMLHAESLLDTTVDPSEASDILMKWYRVFLLDHAASRMQTRFVVDLKGPKQRQDLLEHKNRIISRVEGILTEDLLNEQPIEDGDHQHLLLRAAHFMGHCGNDALQFAQILSRRDRRFYNDIDGKLDESSVRESIESGLSYYQLAINHRLSAYIGSFVTAEQRDVVQPALARCGISEPPPNFARRPSAERFGDPAQAAADIANQFSAMTCLRCYMCVLEPKQAASKHIDGVLEDMDTTGRLWSNLNQLLKANCDTRRFRAIAWRRVFEHMVYIVSPGHGKPIDAYEEPLKPHERKILKRFETLAS